MLSLIILFISILFILYYKKDYTIVKNIKIINETIIKPEISVPKPIVDINTIRTISRDYVSDSINWINLFVIICCVLLLLLCMYLIYILRKTYIIDKSVVQDGMPIVKKINNPDINHPIIINNGEQKKARDENRKDKPSSGGGGGGGGDGIRDENRKDKPSSNRDGIGGSSYENYHIADIPINNNNADFSIPVNTSPSPNPKSTQTLEFTPQKYVSSSYDRYYVERTCPPIDYDDVGCSNSMWNECQI